MALTENFQQLLTALVINGTAINKLTALKISLKVKKSLMAEPLMVDYSINNINGIQILLTVNYGINGVNDEKIHLWLINSEDDIKNIKTRDFFNLKKCHAMFIRKLRNLTFLAF